MADYIKPCAEIIFSVLGPGFLGGIMLHKGAWVAKLL